MTMQFQKKNPRAIISTAFGDIHLKLYAEEAPRHVDNFLNLAKMGFYNGTTFHRVVPGFLIQGGDPLSRKPDRSLHGTGEPGYAMSAEPNDRPHKRGALSMAKMPKETNSTRNFDDNGSQFFICVADSSGLDRRYTVFGEVVRGLDVVDKIVAAPRDERDNPLEPISVTVTVKE
ncbi:MAG: peptidylprolyl isomerase [Nitrospiraceae bacterium]|nr:peptidylprolyl isomerase [Nitrospiraceae bacterium]MSR24382.1 peptidylprolyl isomerase [Nitrospiraceae bacterium]